MSTPTAMKHVALAQGRTPSQFAGATPPVSTPFLNPAHAVFSPRGPRSSPQQFKKSPATSNLLAQPPNGLNFDSPSTAAAMGALGIGSGLDIGLDNMGVGVGGLGSLGAMATEDDKLKRLEAILDILNKKKGLVSEAGLERLAQRIGLDCLSEEHTTADGRKTRMLIIAGSAIQLDITLSNNIVEHISLAFPESAPSVTKHVNKASQILLRDLQLLPNQSPLTKSLDEFAGNLERLATLDKLSIIPGLDCHEALTGIYESLERLLKWDISKLREEPRMENKPDSALSKIAMCSRHGCPVMHAHDKVGLALQYWQQLRNVQPANDNVRAFSEKQEKTWSLQISCASMSGIGYPPVRVSEDWISKEIVKDGESIDPRKPALDWREPDNVMLPPSEEDKGAGMEILQPDLSTARVPQVMFTVTFDPPVILPQNDWMRLYELANVNPPQLYDYPPTFDALYFPLAPGSSQDPSELRTIARQRDVRVFDEKRNSSIKSHHNTLFIYKQIYSRVITEMPFCHPQQLISMLPLLRQYAFISTLLENSFGSKTREMPVKKGRETRQVDFNTTLARDDLAEFQAPATQKPHEETSKATFKTTDELNLDVTLWVHPFPHLQVVFPFRDEPATVSFKILEDGIVEIMSENVIPKNTDGDMGKINGKPITRSDLGKVLEHMEDLSKWAEWVRTRLS